MTLLIIDDNAGNLELLRSALRRPDVEILTAEDPEEGLDLVASRHPQIVLTDLVMPRVTGMEVLERIMAFDPSIDVILMTAHYSTDTAVEAIKKGASDYWNKPVPVETIRRRVDQLLETALNYGRRLAANAPMVLSLLRDFVGEVIPRGPSELAAHGRFAIARVRQSEDAKEGVASFKAKRKPQFKGR